MPRPETSNCVTHSAIRFRGKPRHRGMPRYRGHSPISGHPAISGHASTSYRDTRPIPGYTPIPGDVPTHQKHSHSTKTHTHTNTNTHTHTLTHTMWSIQVARPAGRNPQLEPGAWGREHEDHASHKFTQVCVLWGTTATVLAKMQACIAKPYNFTNKPTVGTH